MLHTIKSRTSCQGAANYKTYFIKVVATLAAIILSFSFPDFLFAQTVCGTQNPIFPPSRFKSLSPTSSAIGTFYSIPVVVHVIYNPNVPAEKLTFKQVEDQIKILSQDYQMQNLTEVNNFPSSFPVANKPVNCGISFCLAKQDPEGKPTNGIEYRANNIIFTNTFDVKEYDRGGLGSWDVNKYLNIWVCHLNKKLKIGNIEYIVDGEGTFPNMQNIPKFHDGVVVDHGSFGLKFFNNTRGLGRTTTHEVGHWLNLFHPWGSGNNLNCTASDEVDDTPPQKQNTFGCPSTQTLTDPCSPNEPGILYMNFMNYSDDNCRYMFTNGQSIRMRTTLDGARSSLQSSPVCSPLETVFLIDITGSMSEEIGGVRNFLTQLLNTPEYTDNYNGTFRLITFNDNVMVNQATTDLNVIKAQVAALTASGGGDCPEGSYEGLLQVKSILTNGGTIMLATDASAHPGSDINGLIASLEDQNITYKPIFVNTLLSGDCSAVSTAVSSLGTNNGQNSIPYPSNNYLQASTSSTGTAAVSANPSAIETYSTICNATRGTFAFIPEVNSTNAIDKKRYENVGFNIMMGSIRSAIVDILPYNGPRGGTVALTISGIKTHFNASTTLTFGDTGIVLKTIHVTSPTKIEATIQISIFDSLGFKNVLVTTILPDGTIDSAKGKGLFQVTTPTTTPTIVSISPSTGKTGETLSATITGINTHFTNASVVNLGTGITVSNVSAVSNVELKATITIDSATTLGYRSVTVTTGTELATESVVGPFLVIAADCNLSGLTLGPDKQVLSDIPDSSCVELKVIGIDTANYSKYAFQWSTGEITPTILACPADDAFYSVTVSRGSCKLTDTLQVKSFIKATLSCPANKTVNSDTSCTAVVNNIDPILTPNVSTAAVTYIMSGATTDTGTTTASGKTFKQGVTNVTYYLTKDTTRKCTFKVTVTDSGCPKPFLCSVTVTPTRTVPNQLLQTIYKGLGAQTVKLTGNVDTGGVAPFTYSWGNAGNGRNINVSPKVTTTYTLDVKDANGKHSICQVTIYVVDFRCGPGNNKISICHKNAANTFNTQCLWPADALIHLAHGDYLGSCNPNIPQLIVKANPNPTYGVFNVYIGTNIPNTPISLKVMSAFRSTVLETRNNLSPNQTITIGASYPKGLYLLKVTQGTATNNLLLLKL